MASIATIVARIRRLRNARRAFVVGFIAESYTFNIKIDVGFCRELLSTSTWKTSYQLLVYHDVIYLCWRYAYAQMVCICICTNGMHMHMHVHMQDARPPYVHMAIEKRLLCGA